MARPVAPPDRIGTSWREQRNVATDVLQPLRHRPLCSITINSGGDSDSTTVLNPEVHAEGVVVLVNQNTTNLLVANDSNFEAAAAAA